MNLLAESYLHQLSPFLIQFTENFGIRWYGVSYLFAFLAGWMLFRWMASSGRSPLTKTGADDLVFWIIVGVLLGGRIGYATFYDPQLFVGFTSSFPFWDLLAINKGGMASHGGIIGFIVAICLFARKHHVSSLHLLDIGAFGSTIGLSVGRLANFINAELWGRALPVQANTPWWSVKYPDEVLQFDDDRIAPIYDQLALTIGGDATFRDAVASELKAGNEQVVEAVLPHLTAYYPSQIFQAITDGPMLMALLLIVWSRPRKPGAIGATWLLGYGVLRIASEQFREPDIGVALLAGLSRGQVLSIVMATAGFVSLFIVKRHNSDRMPGIIGSR